MTFINSTTVKDLAQCALDVYFDSDDNDLRITSFSSNWTRHHSWGGFDSFLGVFYYNRFTSTGVMSIRGTVLKELGDDLADLAYVLGIASNQYKDGLSFLSYLKRFKLWNACQKQYVVGHSLGGIIAKKLAQESKLDTLCFNSPGVDFHRGRNHQKILTLVSEKDPIGNYNSEQEHGQIRIIPESKQKVIAQKNNMKNPSPHSMRLMYLTLSTGEYCNEKF